MRTKFVYEKFKEESDPIHDMGIGLKNIYDNIKPGDVFTIKKDFPGRMGNSNYRKGIRVVIIDVVHFPKMEYNIRIDYKLLNLNGKIIGSGNNWGWSFNFFLKYMQPTNIKECLNEKFKEESDPIQDLNIGIVKKRKTDLKLMREMLTYNTIYNHFFEMYFLNNKIYNDEDNQTFLTRLIYFTLYQWNNSNEIDDETLFRSIYFQAVELYFSINNKTHEEEPIITNDARKILIDLYGFQLDK
jgi:hypothetical protein